MSSPMSYHLNGLVGTQRRIMALAVIALTFTVILAVCAVLSVGAYNKATHAFQAVTNEQNARLQQNADDNLRTRKAFCNLVQPLAASPTPPTASYGTQLKQAFLDAGPILGCTPDPYDSQ